MSEERCIVTFALGEFEQLQALTLPTVERYAVRHGWELEAAAPKWVTRPASWLKIPLLAKALERYEEVLWLDTDVIVIDDRIDIADTVPPGSWQAMVRHHTADGEVPNCGVWLLRTPMIPYLERMWEMTEYLQHGWWEQAGMLDLLGYQHTSRPVWLERETELYRRTHWLEREWNSHESSDRHPTPRFAHATVGSTGWRLEVLRRYAAQDAAATTGG